MYTTWMSPGQPLINWYEICTLHEWVLATFTDMRYGHYKNECQPLINWYEICTLHEWALDMILPDLRYGHSSVAANVGLAVCPTTCPCSRFLWSDPCLVCQFHWKNQINKSCSKWQYSHKNFYRGKQITTCQNWGQIILNLKGKEHKNTIEFCLKVFGKLHILMQTSWKSDSYFWRYCNFLSSKWLPMEAAIWNKH